MWIGEKYYVSLDTEFIRNNLSERGTISYALATEDDAYYAVNFLADTTMYGLTPDQYTWMVANVWKHLPGGHPEEFDRNDPSVKMPEAIRDDVEAFFNRVLDRVEGDIDKVVLYAHCGVQDGVRLRLLWEDDWDILPRSVPNWIDDVKRMRLAAGMTSEDLPKLEVGRQHHALFDAVHELDVVRHILTHGK